MNIRPQLELSPVPRPSWWQNFQKLWVQLAKVINGNLEFGSPGNPGNIRGTWVTVTTPAVGTDFDVKHSLGRMAYGFLVMMKSAPCDVYLSPTLPNNTTTDLKLRATAANVQLSIFVL